MLAPYFKPPGDLGIDAAEHDALVQVLGMLERGEITDDEFDTSAWPTCMVGWARRVGGKNLFSRPYHDWPCGLNDLVGGSGLGRTCRSTAQGAFVLRNYLTTGEPRWHEAAAGALVA